MTAGEYWKGVKKGPKLISLEKGFTASAASKEFVTSAPPPSDVGFAAVKGPQTEKEVRCFLKLWENGI
jgi:hypothetical protein